jgi:hypothetical protein
MSFKPTRNVAQLSLPLLLTVLLMHAAAAQITGRMVGIADVDTLTLLDQGRHQTKVRLAVIRRGKRTPFEG